MAAIPSQEGCLDHFHRRKSQSRLWISELKIINWTIRGALWRGCRKTNGITLLPLFLPPAGRASSTSILFSRSSVYFAVYFRACSRRNFNSSPVSVPSWLFFGQVKIWFVRSLWGLTGSDTGFCVGAGSVVVPSIFLSAMVDFSEVGSGVDVPKVEKLWTALQYLFD
jgi:hypothetical protein